MSGYCQCGCGGLTSVATQTRSERGYRKGEFVPFLHGHGNAKRRVISTHEEDRRYATPCHIWDGNIGAQGYGRVSTAEGRQLAHRHVYAAAHGEIPEGFDVHHLCEQRDCVRLDHLELKSVAEHRSLHARRPRGRR